MQINANMIWPRAQPIERAIGAEVLITLEATSEIDNNDAL